MKLAALLALTLVANPGADPERLYGRVFTADGRVLEGYLRWDRNEVSWTDFLDGAKEIPAEFLRQAESLDPEYAELRRRQRSIEAFGVRITWDEDDDADPFTSKAAIRFGYVASLVALEDHRLLLLLKSGEEIYFRGASTDFGSYMRQLVIEDAQGGETSLRWRQLDRVDFMRAPTDVPAPASRRIHGTVRTWGGLELTGDIAWDRDEVLTSDVLDGRSEGEDYEIPFEEIAGIEWESSRSARVLLRTGEALVLRGTNDVDRNNRGIEILDAALGRAIVPWSEFQSITFHPPEARQTTAELFDNGGPLFGTVDALDGRTIVGAIRWGNDEAARWEVLDGWSAGVDYDIEFSHIHSIVRNGSGGVTVTLLDGRTLDLEDSDDVGEDNGGIFVKPDGRPTRLIRWRDFDRVTFAR